MRKLWNKFLDSIYRGFRIQTDASSIQCQCLARKHPGKILETNSLFSAVCFRTQTDASSILCQCPAWIHRYQIVLHMTYSYQFICCLKYLQVWDLFAGGRTETPDMHQLCHCASVAQQTISRFQLLAEQN